MPPPKIAPPGQPQLKTELPAGSGPVLSWRSGRDRVSSTGGSGGRISGGRVRTGARLGRPESGLLQHFRGKAENLGVWGTYCVSEENRVWDHVFSTYSPGSEVW